MIEQNYNQSWQFWVDKDAFALVWDIPEAARNVTLPHDAMIEGIAKADSRNQGSTGYRDGCVCNYVKLLNVSEEDKNKTMVLKFEGVYMNAFVFVNGQLAGKNPFGYTTFYVSLDRFLKYGEENEIRVQVRNGAMTNSRWYSGGGIYRDVYLLVSDLAHIIPEGVQIKTESADREYAVLNVDTELKNRYHTSMKLVLETQIEDGAGNVLASNRAPVVLFEGEERTLSCRLTVDNPKLWSEFTPEMYYCKSRLYQKESVLDEDVSAFGIRTLQLDSRRGLRVNGRPIKLRGACIHHDSGLLGAATYEDVQYRQIRLLKEAGFNAVRMAHHPIAPAMLRACDELGMYIMDESFDMWNRCKSDYDYGLYFQEWWEKDITAMVRKDYNHPSVIMYSVGNEIPEIGTAHGARLCQDLCCKIKALDGTRYTLAAINGVFAAGDAISQIVADVCAELSKAGKIEGNVNNVMTLIDQHLDEVVMHPAITGRLELACAPADIAGYNYMTGRYEMDGVLYPNRIIVGSETYPPEIARNWEMIQRSSHVIGDFTWTGWDYIGEAGVGIPAYQWGEGGFGAKFPCQLAYVGDLDITGFRRPNSYYREIVFGLRTAPYITVQNPRNYGRHFIKTPWVISDNVASWSWNGCEGKPVIIEVYAPGTTVELRCNGKVIGKKESGKNVQYRTLFETIYEPGTLTAVVFENEAEMGRMELQTAGEKRGLRLQPETVKSQDFIYISVEICDEKGNLATDEVRTLSLRVDGGAGLAGFGSGNPRPKYNYNEPVTETFYGRGFMILKKNGSAQEVKVTVTSDRGEKAECTIN